MTNSIPKRITVRLSKRLQMLLSELRIANCNISEVVRVALEEYLKNLHIDNSGNAQELKRA